MSWSQREGARAAQRCGSAAAAGAARLTALASVLLAMNMPDYGSSILYGVAILALLLPYDREEGEG